MESQENDQSLLLACIVQMHHVWRYAQWTVFIRQTKVLYYTLKIYVSVVVTASMHVLLELLNFHKLEIMALEVKWTNVHSVQAVLKTTCLSPNSKNMAETVLQRANCQYVLKCARPKHFSRVMVTPFQTSSVSALLPGDLDQALGDGVQLIPSKASALA